jgi:uncharacterized protein YjbJ (UPF0337 family)
MIEERRWETTEPQSRNQAMPYFSICLITQEENTMNAEQFKGKWMQFKGELKQKYGKFTDDDLTQIEGNYDKFMGKAQERYGDKKEELMKWANEWQQRPAQESMGKPR